MALETLTDDQIAMLVELTIHRGMLGRTIGSNRYEMYRKIADELLDEMKKRKVERWIPLLKKEYCAVAKIKWVNE